MRGNVPRVDLRGWARLTVSEAVCGYMRQRGVHDCRRFRAGDGEGCEQVSWQGLMAGIEGVLDEVETAGRELGAASR